MSTCFGNDKDTPVGTSKSRSGSGSTRARPGVQNRSHRIRRALAALLEGNPRDAAGYGDHHTRVWMCRIANRVLGMIGICPDGLDGIRIHLFRIDPEWQHTSVPKKLFQRVRRYAQHHGLGRIVVEPRVVPRWLLQSLGRHGFHFEGWRSVCGRELLEFSIARERHPVERSKQRVLIRIRKRRPHWSTRWANSAPACGSDGS